MGKFKLTKSNCGATELTASSYTNCDGTTAFPGTGMEGSETTCCCLVSNLETNCVNSGSCSGKLKEQVENVLLEAGVTGGLFDTNNFDHVVRVDESCTDDNSPFIYDIQISSARKTGTFTGRPIGKVPLIEASQTALNLVATTVERISTGSGDILPKEIQVLRIFGTTKSSSLGGFFQLQLGDDTTGDIHVRAPAMRSKRTRHPDNSMQAAIESLPGVTAPVVVKENDPSAYERYWFISFTQLGNVPQLTISTKSTCDMTASQTETTLSITSQSISESSGVTVTQTSAGVTVTGTLKTTLSGDTTSIVIRTASGVVFINTADVVIGGTTVTASNVNAVSSAVYTQLLTGTPGTKTFTVKKAVGSTQTSEWVDFWQGTDSDYIEEYIQLGDLAESSYDLFKVASRNAGTYTFVVDRLINSYFSTIKLQWCDSSSFANTYAWIKTVKDGSLDISLYPTYRGNTAASVAPYQSGPLLRYSNTQGKVIFNNLAIFPKYFDVHLPFVDLETEPPRSQAIRAPLYTLEFNVQSLPGLTTGASKCSTSMFSILPDRYFSLDTFSPMLNMGSNQQGSNTDFGWYPDINVLDSKMEIKPSVDGTTFSCVNRPLRMFAKTNLKRISTSKIKWTFTVDVPSTETYAAGDFVTQGGHGPAYKISGGNGVGNIQNIVAPSASEFVVITNTGVVLNTNTDLSIWKFNTEGPRAGTPIITHTYPASTITAVVQSVISIVPTDQVPASTASRSVAYRIIAIDNRVEWTITIASQAITKNANVQIVQINTDVTVKGTLKTDLTGGTTTLIIQTSSDVTFTTTNNLVIGGDTTVLAVNVLTATLSSSASGNVLSLRGNTIATAHVACVGTTNVQQTTLSSATTPPFTWPTSFVTIQKVLGYFTTPHKDLCVEANTQTESPGNKWCSQQDIVATFDNIHLDTSGDVLFRVVPNVAPSVLQMPMFSIFCDTAVTSTRSFSLCGTTIQIDHTTVAKRSDDGSNSLEKMLENACPEIVQDVVVVVTGSGDRTTVCRNNQHSGGLTYVAINSTKLTINSLDLSTTLSLITHIQWSFTLGAGTSPTATSGTTVTQGNSQGFIKVALTGSAVSTIVISSASDVTFTTLTDLIIGTDGDAITIAASAITAATSIITDLQIGSLWSDHQTRVNNGASQPPVVVTAGASIYATQSKQPYRSNPIEYVSKTVSPLNIVLPEVIRDYETFSVTVELHSSSGEIVQSVVNNDACINLITGSATDDQKRSCGDISLPRTLRLSAYASATYMDLYASCVATKGSEILTIVSRDLTNAIQVGDNLHVMTGTDSSLFTYYRISAIATTTITLDRYYDSKVLTNDGDKHTITTLFTKSDPAKNTFGRTEWKISITSQSLTKSAGVLITQGTGSSGTLKIALTGATTIIYITTTSGVTFTSTSDIIVGGTTIANGNIASVSNDQVIVTTSNTEGKATTLNNLEFTKPNQGVYLQANDQTCYKVQSVEIKHDSLPSVSNANKVGVTGCLNFDGTPDTTASSCMEGQYKITYYPYNHGITNMGPYWPPSELGTATTIESAGMQIYLDGPNSNSDKIVTIASLRSNGITGAGTTVAPLVSLGYLDEETIAQTLTGTTFTASSPCLRFGSEFSLQLQATADEKTLFGGYFSLDVTHRGTTETTTRIYYYEQTYPVVVTESDYIESIRAALSALPNVPNVIVKTRPDLSESRSNYRGLTWTFTISSTTLDKAAGVVVTQAIMTWTFTITSTTFTSSTKQDVNVVVSQTSNSGTGKLSVALLSGKAYTTVTITSAIGQVFDTAADLTVGTQTILASNLLTVTSVSSSSGTLKTVLSGSSTSVVVTSDIGTMFDTTAILIVGGTSIPANTITAVSNSNPTKPYTKSTTITLLFYNVDRSITVAFNEKQIWETDTTDTETLDISATANYILLKQSRWNSGTTTPPTDENRYSTRAGPITIASSVVSQLLIEENDGKANQGWISKEIARKPFVVRATDSAGSLVRSAVLNNLLLETVADGRWQSIYCTGNSGTFTLSAYQRDGVTLMETAPIPYDGTSNDVANALDAIYVKVGTVSIANDASTMTVLEWGDDKTINTHVLSFLKTHSTIRLNTLDPDSCNSGLLYQIKSVDVLTREITLTSTYTGSTNSHVTLCIQPFPKPKVTLGPSSHTLCSTGIVGIGGIDNVGRPLGSTTRWLPVPASPEPFTIRFDAPESLYWWNKYPTFRTNVNSLNGPGGKKQTFTCIATETVPRDYGRFRMEYRGASTEWINGQTSTLSSITTRINALSTMPSTVTVTVPIEWTLTITSQVVTENAGVAISQTVSANVVVTGTLKTSLTGAGTTTVIVQTTSDMTFVTNKPITIGTTEIGQATVTAAATPALGSFCLVSPGRIFTIEMKDDVLKNGAPHVEYPPLRVIQKIGSLSITGITDWTFTMTSATPTLSKHALVTQGVGDNLISGTLKYILTGSAVTTLVITSAADVTFDTTKDIIIGSTTFPHSALTAVTSSNGNQGEMSVISSGTPSTNNSPLISSTSSIPITDNIATIEEDGKAYFRNAKIQETGLISLRARPQSYDGLVQTLTCQAKSGQFRLAFAGSYTAFIDYDATASTVQTELSKLHNITAGEWSFTTNSQNLIETKGSTVTQGSNSGTLKTNLIGDTTALVITTVSGLTFVNNVDLTINSIEWTLAITSQDITEEVGSVVSQGSVVYGVLTTALTGASTTIVLRAQLGKTFITTEDVTIGSTTVVKTNVNTATNNGAVTTTILANNILTSTGTEGIEVHDTLQEWTLTITAQSITQNAGSAIKQGEITVGLLKYTLIGSGTTTVVIETIASAVFLTDVDVIIGENPATTIAHSSITGATGTDRTLCSTSNEPFYIEFHSIVNDEKPHGRVVQAKEMAFLPLLNVVYNTLSTSLNIDWSFDINSASLTAREGTSVTQITTQGTQTGYLKKSLTGGAVSEIEINSLTTMSFNAISDVVIATPEWTLVITSAVTADAGVTVTQGTNIGILKTSVTSATTIVVTASSTATFVSTADVIVGSTTVIASTFTSATSDSGTTTIALANLIAATPDTTGTLIVEKLYTSLSSEPIFVGSGRGTRLQVLQQPSAWGEAAVPLLIQPSFELVDDSGHRHISSSDTVQLELVQRGRATFMRCDASSGTFRLEWNRQRTNPLAASSTATQIHDALLDLSNVQGVNVTCDILGHNGHLPYSISSSTHDDVEITITSATVTKNAGVQVSQTVGDVTVLGILKFSLTGAGTTLIRIQTVPDVIFVNTAAIIIDSGAGGSPITISDTNVLTVVASSTSTSGGTGTGGGYLPTSTFVCNNGGNVLCTMRITEINCASSNPNEHSHCNAKTGFIPPITRVKETDLLECSQGYCSGMTLNSDLKGTLTGTLIVPLIHGVASFTDVSIDSIGRGWQLRASLMGRSSLTTGAVAPMTDSIFIDVGEVSTIVPFTGSSSMTTFTTYTTLPTDQVPYNVERNIIMQVQDLGGNRIADGGEAFKTWTFTTTTSETPTAVVGATVTQGSSIGTIKVALTGGTVTTVVLLAESTVTFITTADLIVSGTTDVTIAHLDLTAVTDFSIMSVELIDINTNLPTTDGSTVSPSFAPIYFGLANFTNVKCSTSRSNGVRLKFSTETPDLLLNGPNTTKIEWYSPAMRCVGPAVNIVVALEDLPEVASKDVVQPGALLLPMKVKTSNENQFVSIESDSTSILNVVNRGDAVVFYTDQFVSSRYLIHTGNDYTAFSLPLDRPYSEKLWAIGITTSTITEKKGVVVSQKEFTVVVASQTISELADVIVTQSNAAGVVTATGTLKLALTGTTTTFIISTSSDMSFTPDATLLIGSTTVLLNTITTCINTLDIKGTLATALTGAGMTTVMIQTNSIEHVFVTTSDIMVGTSTLIFANINTASVTNMNDGNMFVRQVSTGGRPLPQQPSLIVTDLYNTPVPFDFTSTIHTTLRPTPSSIDCGGVLSSTNRIQTIACDADGKFRQGVICLYFDQFFNSFDKILTFFFYFNFFLIFHYIPLNRYIYYR